MADDQDLMLPIANVGRLMKQILPEGAKITKEAKQIMQESATEFVSFVTSEASAKCQNENRRTVNGDDICWALSALGFDHYAESIISYLHKYRKVERMKVAANSKNNNFDGNNNIISNNNASNSTCPEIDDDHHQEYYNVQEYSYGGHGYEVNGQLYDYASPYYRHEYSSVRADLQSLWEV